MRTDDKDTDGLFREQEPFSQLACTLRHRLRVRRLSSNISQRSSILCLLARLAIPARDFNQLTDDLLIFANRIGTKLTATILCSAISGHTAVLVVKALALLFLDYKLFLDKHYNIPIFNVILSVQSKT